jgi:hypothetical protein
LKKPRRVGKKFKTYHCLVNEMPNSHAICTLLQTGFWFSKAQKGKLVFNLCFTICAFLNLFVTACRMERKGI